MDNLEKINDTLFENIKHVDEYENEYWLARELMTALEYKQWRRFEESMRAYCVQKQAVPLVELKSTLILPRLAKLQK